MWIVFTPELTDELQMLRDWSYQRGAKMLGKYWDKKGKQGETYDYIVIGSGMGGMTAAAMLSKLGKKVLVLEQHLSLIHI